MSGPSSPEPDLSGTVLGRYRLERRVGVGGMGSVYEAQHELLDKRVAIKVLHSELATRPAARKRFLREARAASRVEHPNVVEIYDVAFAGNYVFFVMELLRGQDLAQRLEVQPRMSWPEAAPILQQIVAGLEAAHSAGVIHRDVKPSNCLLIPDAGAPAGVRVKVVDFGIAKVAQPEQSMNSDDLTGTGEIFGTAGYMAPEMAAGPTNDPRSDIYELGVLMFRVLAGRMPFTGTPLQVLSQHIAKSPPSPRSFEPSIPAQVEAIVLRAMEKSPDDRQPSMRQLGAALRRAQGAADSAEPTPPPAPRSPAGKPRRGHAAIDRAAVINLDDRPSTPPQSSRDPEADPWRDALRGRTSVYGDATEPPLPPMPGETRGPQGSPTGAFGPREDTRLELDLPTDGPGGESTARRGWSGFGLRWIVGLGVLAAVGTAVWMFRDTSLHDVSEGVGDLAEEVGLSEDAEPILLLVDTVPKKARVYIDDVRREERPIRVPRSDEYIRVRVEADGYEPRVIQVKPSRTRQLEVELSRAKKKR
ncbi:MAG: protein kinase [Deltaproteobacteria bacterium]|nr:protein kinase [Deltaproteobacteria bacterium]